MAVAQSGTIFFFRHAGNHVEVGLTGTDSSDADTKALRLTFENFARNVLEEGC